MQLRSTDWVFAFVHGFRYEASKLKPEETQCFEPCVKEQMLTKPCQVEVMELANPHRVAFVFLFDRTKRDLLIHISHEKWESLDVAVARILNRYPATRVNGQKLRKMLKRCRTIADGTIYSIDFIKNACCICFTHDPRVKATPLPWMLNSMSDPQEVADMIFNLNHCQAVDEVEGPAILEMATKELTEKYGYKIVKRLTKKKDEHREKSGRAKA